jgi:hypothetical protein
MDFSVLIVRTVIFVHVFILQVAIIYDMAAFGPSL